MIYRTRQDSTQELGPEFWDWDDLIAFLKANSEYSYITPPLSAMNRS